jgi:hypothetical protein
MLSVVKLVKEFTKAGLEWKMDTLKSPYISNARNGLTCLFLQSGYDYLLFIDSDVEFKPEAVIKMLITRKDVVLTPYRVIIHRCVFKALMKNYPRLKMKNKKDTYLYNFWDTTFDLDKGLWRGEDVSFCNLVRESDFKIYANIKSETTHHGNFGWKGKFGDSLEIKKDTQ